MKSVNKRRFMECRHHYVNHHIMMALLEETIAENERMALSRFIESRGVALFEAARVQKMQHYSGFPDFDGAKWMPPNLVCMVQYMERTNGGGLCQPVFRGLRDYMLTEGCVYVAD